MDTWDTGPFDKDTAADFAHALDDAEPEAREALIRGVLSRTIDATGYLTEAEKAVAAAALIAARCPGGEPVAMSYGPKQLCPCSLPTYGPSPTKPSPASPATRTGSFQAGRPGGLKTVAVLTHPPSRSACPGPTFHRSLRCPAKSERHSPGKLNQNPFSRTKP